MMALVVASAAAVQEILRVFREFDFAGSVGAAGKAATVLSAGLVTYVPAGTPSGRVDQMIGAVVSAHPPACLASPARQAVPCSPGRPNEVNRAGLKKVTIRAMPVVVTVGTVTAYAWYAPSLPRW